MQDKFAIGPVTIVQLVGLANKPRIASAPVDAAVRAVDHQPTMSTAAGVGSELLRSVDETQVQLFDIKAPQGIALTAAPMRGSISFEAGVDRPVSDSSGPATPSPFDNLPANFDLAALIASLRQGSTSPQETEPDDPVQPAPLPATTPTESKFTEPDAAAPGPEAIFDGETSFGDDKILNFEAYYHESGLIADKMADVSADGMIGAMEPELFIATDFISNDVVAAFAAQPSEAHSPDGGLPVDPQHQASATDAIATI